MKESAPEHYNYNYGRLLNRLLTKIENQGG